MWYKYSTVQQYKNSTRMYFTLTLLLKVYCLLQLQLFQHHQPTYTTAVNDISLRWSTTVSDSTPAPGLPVLHIEERQEGNVFHRTIHPNGAVIALEQTHWEVRDPLQLILHQHPSYPNRSRFHSRVLHQTHCLLVIVNQIIGKRFVQVPQRRSSCLGKGLLLTWQESQVVQVSSHAHVHFGASQS